MRLWKFFCSRANPAQRFAALVLVQGSPRCWGRALMFSVQSSVAPANGSCQPHRTAALIFPCADACRGRSRKSPRRSSSNRFQVRRLAHIVRCFFCLAKWRWNRSLSARLMPRAGESGVPTFLSKLVVLQPAPQGSIGLTIEGTAPVVVTSVVPSGVADAAGVATGDRIFEVSGVPRGAAFRRADSLRRVRADTVAQGRDAKHQDCAHRQGLRPAHVAAAHQGPWPVHPC